jgi:hypothetical protein
MRKYLTNRKGNKVVLSELKTERQADAFGALF